jgi:hypothetical protein
LGKQFPDTLKKADIAIEKHTDHFADNAKDEEWLTAIGKRGWYAITFDRRIRYKPNEKAAVKKFGVGLFVLVGKSSIVEHSRNFILTLPKIITFIDKNPPPFIAKIYCSEKKGKKTTLQKPGYVTMWESFINSGVSI